MKTKLIHTGTILLSGLLFFTGCRKEIKDKLITSEASSQLQTDAGGNKKGCRLVFATNTDPTYSQDFTFHYNDKGLADKWDIANYGLFEQEYDDDGRLIKSVHTENGQVAFTISFFYKGNKVVKEIYYYGSGTDIMDVDYYKYNTEGKLVKVKSFLNDWEALTKYNADGNIIESELLFSGIPVYSAFLTYDKHYTNPYHAVPGIDHGFPYYTPADFFYSNWLWAGFKQVGYDEYGNAIVAFDYEPSQTQWQADRQNYAVAANYYDVLSGGWFTYNYEFENCDAGMENNVSNSQTMAPSNVNAGGKINPMMLLLRNPSKSMKEQVQEFRQQLKNISNSKVVK